MRRESNQLKGLVSAFLFLLGAAACGADQNEVSQELGNVYVVTKTSPSQLVSRVLDARGEKQAELTRDLSTGVDTWTGPAFVGRLSVKNFVTDKMDAASHGRAAASAYQLLDAQHRSTDEETAYYCMFHYTCPGQGLTSDGFSGWCRGGSNSPAGCGTRGELCAGGFHFDGYSCAQ